MEELKQLIREDKEIIAVLDHHIKDLSVVLNDLKDIRSDFTKFFEKQDRFMELMSNLLEDNK